MVQAKKVFKASTGLKVEVDDTYFRTGATDLEHNHMKENKSQQELDEQKRSGFLSFLFVKFLL